VSINEDDVNAYLGAGGGGAGWVPVAAQGGGAGWPLVAAQGNSGSTRPGDAKLQVFCQTCGGDASGDDHRCVESVENLKKRIHLLLACNNSETDRRRNAETKLRLLVSVAPFLSRLILADLRELLALVSHGQLNGVKLEKRLTQIHDANSVLLALAMDEDTCRV
jgi:hypothetical protein